LTLPRPTGEGGVKGRHKRRGEKKKGRGVVVCFSAILSVFDCQTRVRGNRGEEKEKGRRKRREATPPGTRGLFAGTRKKGEEKRDLKDTGRKGRKERKELDSRPP